MLLVTLSKIILNRIFILLWFYLNLIIIELSLHLLLLRELSLHLLVHWSTLELVHDLLLVHVFHQVLLGHHWVLLVLLSNTLASH